MSTFGNRGNHNTGNTNRADNNRDNRDNGKQNSDKFDIRRSWVGNLFFGSKLKPQAMRLGFSESFLFRESLMESMVA